ncbi:MAG: MMPL family transporter [Gammaproteobacteria bacterium]|nr:MAG: MMPL family transporter [Gammaproteobacteria bacterium]
MTGFLERLIFRNRGKVLLFFAIVSVGMFVSALNFRLDAGFEKLLPAKHEYMQTFFKYQLDFGGANRILIAVTQKKGDIFNPKYFEKLKAITDEVFFIDGVERSSVTSLFTPNVRFIEVVEGGFSGGNVIPAEFRPTPEWFGKVRENIQKTGKVGILVSSDFRSAIVSAVLIETNPQSGQKVDYLGVASQLEQIRQKYADDDIEVHIIGFAKLIGDVVEGFSGVFLFFFVTLGITSLLLYAYTRSVRLSLLPLFCSLIAVIWQQGLLPILGYGIDPMSILVPFLVFAIGISHGVQMVNAARVEGIKGRDSLQASRTAFRRLLLPGSVALISDTLGFMTIMLIEIEIIRELAIAASLGIAVILLTNLFLLPVLLSYIPPDCLKRFDPVKSGKFWKKLSSVCNPPLSKVVILIAVGMFAYGMWVARDMKIGDLEAGAPELHADSRYNRDIDHITSQFAIGVDVLTTIVETDTDACTNYNVMDAIDRFAWHIRNVEGVQTVVTLPGLAKVVNAGWYEGTLKWRVLSRNSQVLAQAVYPFDTSTGLLNSDCSVMAVQVFTKDHRAETIARIVAEIKSYTREHVYKNVGFRLASGNVGVMAATNEAVDAAQIPMLIYVYAAIIGLCLLAFRTLLGTLCIILPLALVSVLTYALMVKLGIGLKVATLPVVALGVGIGVDYGIYIFSRLRDDLQPGVTLKLALQQTFMTTGNAVLFTALTLAIGVSTWIFSDLKFQVDMGILLTFVFIANMLAAMILLPALATWLVRPKYKQAPELMVNTES